MESKIILGLDLGTASVGWALLRADSEGEPEEIIKLGVRIFPEGMIKEKFSYKSLNAERREKRQARRQARRRARRKKLLLNSLVRLGLLPKEVEARREVFSLKEPYKLRSEALRRELTPYEFGRALYNLGQRRGYLSNRRSGTEKDGAVAQGIGEVAADIEKGKYQTLGEYLSSLSNDSRKRGYYTARRMYEDEFSKITEYQKQFHSCLTDENISKLKKAIFFQRPLKSQASKIGYCSLEPMRKRAPIASPVFQRFRLLQDINNLLIIRHNGEQVPLSALQREDLFDTLDGKESMTWGKIKDLLSLHQTDTFNLESSKTGGLKGNKTYDLLRKALKKKWAQLDERQREQLFYDLFNIEDESALKRRLATAYSFIESEIEALIEKSQKFPTGVCKLSSSAMRKMLPYLQEGQGYSDAARSVGYHHSKKDYEIQAQLPLPENFIETKYITNPLVKRALYQLRRVVNAIVKKYGTPDIIRVELARDLKMNSVQRDEYTKRQRVNEKANDVARKWLEAEMKISNPSRTDIIRYRLWEECGHECPYTGKAISCGQLFGDHPEFDIEHILPYKRTLDDSYANKTLCHVDENRAAKGNKTPFEAYAGDQERYTQILGRVKSTMPHKLSRFIQRELEVDNFISRQLNDTRYISRAARSYLMTLGVPVQVGKGAVTSRLRREFELIRLFNSQEKTRDDHRHHAIDALVVGLTSPRILHQISSQSRYVYGKLELDNFRMPIQGLRSQVEELLPRTIVSHKSTRKVNGAFHKDTVYGKREINGKEHAIERKPLEKIESDKHVNEIIDPTIRELARQRLAEDKKLSSSKPLMISNKDGSQRLVRRVRTSRPVKVRKITRGHVQEQNNHHVVIYSCSDNPNKWLGLMCSAMAIKTKQGLTLPPNAKVHMKLHKNDMVMLDQEGKRQIFRLHKMSQGKTGAIELTLYSHATAFNPTTSKTSIRMSPNTFGARNASLIQVSVLGEVSGRYGSDS